MDHVHDLAEGEDGAAMADETREVARGGGLHTKVVGADGGGEGVEIVEGMRCEWGSKGVFERGRRIEVVSGGMGNVARSIDRRCVASEIREEWCG